MKTSALLLATLALSLATTAAPARQDGSSDKSPIPPARSETPAKAPLTPMRGELLYQNHCTACHTSVAHVRSNRRANSVTAVEAWVIRWSGELKLGWTEDEVTDVTQHLVQRYYKFDSAPGK
jgi:cytochrome c5